MPTPIPREDYDSLVSLRESAISAVARFTPVDPPPPWAPVLTLTAVPSMETGEPTDLIADPTGTPSHPDGEMVCAMRLAGRGNFHGGGSPLQSVRINGAAHADMTPGVYTVELEVTVNGLTVSPIATATYTVTQNGEPLVVSVP